MDKLKQLFSAKSEESTKPVVKKNSQPVPQQRQVAPQRQPQKPTRHQRTRNAKEEEEEHEYFQTAPAPVAASSTNKNQGGKVFIGLCIFVLIAYIAYNLYKEHQSEQGTTIDIDTSVPSSVSSPSSGSSESDGLEAPPKFSFYYF